ncbi:hypothetical protein DPMN_178760 [Dreissena polymorpha]|uniref:Uncharacterized protein n=1 Tax=Dreissena polymorpha TaxID=45954 RepID=A0A9D4IK67_DREPO|nr:hypothetical protein DPMN_178760 [Dreissena polymorpha]
MSHAFERFLKVDEVEEELTLVLQVFLNIESAVEDLWHCFPFSPESSLALPTAVLWQFFSPLKMLRITTLLGWLMRHRMR